MGFKTPNWVNMDLNSGSRMEDIIGITRDKLITSNNMPINNKINRAKIFTFCCELKK